MEIQVSGRDLASSRVDGGRSRAVRRSLEPLLEEVAGQLGADVCLALYQAFSSEEEICMLAGVASPGVALPLPNEPLALSIASATVHPRSARDLVLTSVVREYRIELAAALVVPWRDASGRGYLIAGQLPTAWHSGTLDLTTAKGFLGRLKETHRIASLEGAVRLQGDVSKAVRFVHEITVEVDEVSTMLEAIVRAAKTLLGTEVAYVSLPDSDPNYFVFTTLLNIRTSAFRRLRMRTGQGLGGFTAEQLRTIRSLNYASDDRLRDAPVAETLGEGILSAMCTPLVAGGEILGLLYVGNRHLTPFTPTDESLIERFAEHATLGIRRAHVDSFRASLIQHREKERLAAQLHDSVVRSLLEIGLHAEEGLTVPGDPGLRHRFSIIGRAAEYCLEQLRSSIADLTEEQPPSTTTMSIGQIFESLRPIQWRPVDTSFESPNTKSSETLRPELAQAVLRIAREAIDNAQLHSGCTQHRMVLEILGDAVTLVIADNGKGMSPDEIEELLIDDSRHFGLRGMRAAARRVGGNVRIYCGSDGGLAVEARLPLEPTPG